MIYDLAPGQLVETPDGVVLHEPEVEQARAKLAAGTKLETVARALGAKVYSPAPQPARHVAVEYDQLVAMVGEDRATELLASAPR